MSEINPVFGKWRQRLWPVRSAELVKLLPLLLLKFCVSFNYTVLHAIKDTLIVTTKGSGAEAIPILKGWVVLFSAFLAMICYAKLSNILTKSNLFYACMAPFILFFFLFGYWIFPNRELLIPTQMSNWLLDLIGNSHAHWIAVFKYWFNSLFFVMAEFWGGIVIGLLFWGFANQVCTFGEALRFYTLFALGGHIGVMAAGPLLWFTNDPSQDYQTTMQVLMTVVTGICLLMCALYWYLNNKLATATNQEQIKKENAPNKLSLRESIQYVIRSPYLGWIALMVIAYSMSVNMVEVAWKATLKIQYPNASDYQSFMGIVSSCIGFISFFLALFVGGNLLRKWGWRAGAYSTPLVLGIMSIAFFSLYCLRETTFMQQILSSNGITPLFLIVIVGALHNISCKSMKYCLFDPTKEMAYIPLDSEAKVKGKAAVDVVAARFGKSGSSWIQAFLIDTLGAGSILSITHLLLPFIAVIVGIWMLSVRSLGSMYSEAKENKLNLAKDELASSGV